ncbi:unnamed protein product [Prorocentrum cordatum]|uniref:C3H1-type domain-containing protein n=1 Tax=Prorocentrum cordatum TaxID=2364126 RepID=A0ABN9T8W4_9DINO|nr:unnamed protein product [Polarella glacialis]
MPRPVSSYFGASRLGSSLHQISPSSRLLVMSEAQRTSALQVLQLASCGDSGEAVAVWLLDESVDGQALCRQWLRAGCCSYGERCRHAHTLTLVGCGLRAARGASMPPLIRAEPNSVVAGSSGSPPVGFIVFGQEAVFDYEDPAVARRFLNRASVQGASEEEVEVGNMLFASLESEAAVRVLECAGMFSSWRATAACRDWRDSGAALRLREEIYYELTGFRSPGCTATELGHSNVWPRQRNCLQPWPPERHGLPGTPAADAPRQPRRRPGPVWLCSSTRAPRFVRLIRRVAMLSSYHWPAPWHISGQEGWEG